MASRRKERQELWFVRLGIITGDYKISIGGVAMQVLRPFEATLTGRKRQNRKGQFAEGEVIVTPFGDVILKKYAILACESLKKSDCDDLSSSGFGKIVDLLLAAVIEQSYR
jgi:hypothetical protein